MFQFIEVEISNTLDDHTRVEVLVYDVADQDIAKYINEIAEESVTLCEWSGEKICQIKKIKPQLVCTKAFEPRFSAFQR